MFRFPAARPAVVAEPLTPGLRRAAWVVMIGASMSFLDSTIVNVALRSLSASLHASLAGVQWAVFTVGSALCALSASLDMLVACRVLQGAGGGAILPVGTMIWTGQASKGWAGRLSSGSTSPSACSGASWRFACFPGRPAGTPGRGAGGAGGRDAAAGRVRGMGHADQATASRPAPVRQPDLHGGVGDPVQPRRGDVRRHDPHAVVLPDRPGPGRDRHRAPAHPLRPGRPRSEE